MQKITPELKRIIATALATGGIVSGAFAVANDIPCDHTMKIDGEDFCVAEEVYQEIQSNLQPNEGFGGVRFKSDPRPDPRPEPMVPRCLKDELMYRNETSCICEGVAEQTEEGLICRDPKG